MIEASRAEPGCGGYDYAVDMLEPDLMRVRELWRDEQALKDHFATPHMAAFLKSLRELRPVSVTVKCYELGPERKMPNALPIQPRFQVVPLGPSSKITPLALSSSRMRSDSLKSLVLRAA